MRALPRPAKTMKHPVDSSIEPVINIRRTRGKFNSYWLTSAVLVVSVALWQVVSMAGIFPAFALPSPVAVWQAFVEIVRNGYGGQALISDILISCFRIVIGFVGAIAIGVPIGLLMSRNKIVFDIIDPLLQFIRPVPPLAYIPLLVVWFGIGELPKAILILVGTIPVIIIGTMSGVKSTPALRISVARTLGASNAQIFRRVVLPSALPEIFTAMRVGIGVAWTCLVAAELIAASSGLGWLVQFAGQALQVAIVIVGIVIIGLIGYAMELVIRRIENWVVPWRGHN
ncbi:NitT/TauT family transport system permease protein/taurine transport system permease protein [Paraburkholderia susongensis]|uniref:NitT/TauT family transport system permease protein/taurine transport system permease protein n=1 Tax=Paraburkholderia susongensis TaxID=1515439 RepID=A0A1X7K0Y9_9BURK|nr:NitT/TauT family transport system permease protein/taurine transport system permease protein [Paraburkholderia susongensis]